MLYAAEIALDVLLLSKTPTLAQQRTLLDVSAHLYVSGNAPPGKFQTSRLH